MCVTRPVGWVTVAVCSGRLCRYAFGERGRASDARNKGHVDTAAENIHIYVHIC